MIVLHVIDSLALGGAQTAIKAVMESPGTSQFYLAVLRTVHPHMGIANARVNVCPFESKFSLGPLFYLRRLILKHRVELLHCHLLRSQIFGLLVRRLWFPRLKIVFQEHGQVLGSDLNFDFEEWIYRRFVRWAAPRVDFWVANSNYTLKALVAFAPLIAEKSAVIYNPIRTFANLVRDGEATERWRKMFGIPAAAFAVGFAGRIIKRKGWRELLAAIRLLVPRENISLLIAGDGPDCPEMQKMLNDAVFFNRARHLGSLNDMWEFYGALDCLVVPSHWEPQGLVQIEAQSLGVPVIVSDVPGMRETVAHERNALMFEPHNVKQLSEQISRLIHDHGLKQRLSREGVINARSFSVSGFLETLERVYRKVGGLVSS